MQCLVGYNLPNNPPHRPTAQPQPPFVFFVYKFNMMLFLKTVDELVAGLPHKPATSSHTSGNKLTHLQQQPNSKPNH
jgi:hypothetical protein